MADQPPPYSGYPQQQPGYQPQQPGYPPQQPGYPPQQPGYPPQQPGYPPPQPQYPSPQPVQPAPVQQQTQSSVVVVTQPAPVVMPVTVGPFPMMMQCPYCGATVTTSITYREGTFTWLLVLVMALFLLWPLCLIPFCIDGCKDVQHNCPNCHRQVGMYRRM